MQLLALLLLVVWTVNAREFTEAEVLSFPELFHLDDYERCLAKTDGLYCLGVFDLTPDVRPNPTYERLKTYSDESYRHFNRTRIHRGYCVSSRCPQDTTHNASQRFQRCADEWARARTLRASINTLQYCHTHADRYAEQPRTRAQEIFLQCIYAIVVLNIIGTIYDVCTGDKPDKNKLLTAFSIPTNWQRLRAIHTGGDKRLTALRPLNGIRVVAMFIVTYGHTNMFHYTFYIQNPEELERHIQRFDGRLITDGTSLIQGLMTLTSFLTCYNLLIYSEQRPLSLSLLPLCIIKRIIRIMPVNMLVIGFAATWWTHLRDGPLVPTTIGLESSACQSKFWYHIFYLNNIVDSSNYCVTPSWFLAADMHMYILVCTLTLVMWQRRRTALKLYPVLLVASVLFIGVVAYIKEYKSALFVTTPENIRRVFRDSPSITDFYISSWSSLPSCFLGLILAHVQYELNERKIKLHKYTWFVVLHTFAFPLIYFWALIGNFARKHNTPLFYATYVALDRPLYSMIVCLMLLGLINVASGMRVFYSWKPWTILSRMALSVMLLHWCVNLTISSRPMTSTTSVLDMIVDWTATNSITYILAIPITVFLEIPMQKFLGTLLF